MTQATVLAAADTAANSSDITVVSGASVTISLFSVSALPASCSMDIILKTPGSTMVVGNINRTNPTTSIYAPGVYYVARSAGSNPGVNVGVSVDS